MNPLLTAQSRQTGDLERAESKVDATDLLNDAERASVLELGDGGPGVASIPGFAGCCLYDLIAAQAERSPQAIAVIEPGREITYRELFERANGLGRQLSELGTGPMSKVAILTDRSAESIIGVLGILAAGAAYVPLDPSFPDDRIAFVLDDASVQVLLAPESLVQRASSVAGRGSLAKKVLVIASAPTSATHPGSAVGPEDAAYVIYTSGSTGTPKGVVVDHRSAVNLVQGFVARHDFAGHRLLMIPPLVFDASVGDVFPVLAVGATIVLHPAPAELGSLELEQFCREFRITAIDAPAALWRRWTESFAANGRNGALLPDLALMMIGGEGVSVQHVRRFAQLTGNRVALANHYGPTEASVCATMLTTRDASELSGTDLPIGKPLPGVRVYVLDEDLQLIQPGIEGELCIGGVGVARGYLNRPELTAERFIRDPFSPEANARMYRTGDLVRWNDDGTLQFIGRCDHQVKVRGSRVELGEIEARLAEHASVREAVVLAREDNPGDKRLVAYVRPAGPAERIDIEALRTHLSALLPEYMVPAAYVALEQFPLTTNGKLDRKALPAPQLGAYVSRGYEAPVGDVESTVARIWAEVLKLERVGRNDNFFELGGHSLLAVTVIERMREAGLAVDVRALFAMPTLKGLAEAVGGESLVVVAPPNLIPERSTAITPEMLPLVSLSQGDIDKIVAVVPGGAENVQDIYPLVPMQEGFLFHHLLEQQGDVYLAPTLFSIDSREHVDRYVKALQVIIDRHDTLRTAVLWEGLPEPVQVVWRHAQLRVEEVKLDAAAGDITEQLRARFDPRHYRLDVREAPLWQLFIAEDAPNKRWVILELMHHLIGDHVTLQVMQEEIQMIVQDQEERLPKPLPFRNFVAQARLGVSREEHETFFTRMLGDVDEPTVPFGLSDVLGDGSQIVETRYELDAELCQRLRAQARALGVGMASVCHLAWGLVLARASGRDDVVFGTVMFGRMQGGEGAERMMGIFINTLPVRIKIRDEGVRASVRQTHELLTQLLRHEHAPLLLVQRCSKVLAPAPLFTSLLNYRYVGDKEAILVRDAVDLQDGDHTNKTQSSMKLLQGSERTNYPFGLYVNDLGQGLSMDAQVHESLDPRRVCGLMEKALESLATALEEAPEAAVCGLDVLPAEERRQVLYEWNATGVEYEKEQCIHKLFEAQARLRPEAIAVSCEGRTLTYGELNRQANRLAHYLRGLGVRPDERVALCAERSLEMVVGILGILKAGGGYVPLDPAYPAERLEYMLHDSGPVVLLVHLSEEKRGDLNALLTRGSIPVVDLEKEAGIGGAGANSDLNPADPGVKPHHLAYVIYTSGSTGKPKGVMVEHSNVVRLFSATQEWFHFDRNDVWTLFHSYAFDFSVWEIWGSLAYGGKLVVVPQLTTRSPQEFYRLLCEEKVTVLNQTPSAFRQLIAAQGEDGAGHRLRYVIFGGEALEVSSLRPWYEREVNRETRLVNMYGITETTVHVTYRLLEPADTKALGASPIGRRIPDLTIYILDSHQQPVPIGVVGEMYVGGAGVARGYLNRAELTAERFVRDPFAAAGGARMYRTGDLGRWLGDGSIEYLGRNDHQVKIRGFRIELGEIEARLAEHPSVGEAAVLAREDQAGEKRLVAYYTTAEDFAEEAGAEVLRGYLGGKLPEYMVPAAYVRLEKFPLTANGKLDRKALPSPEREAYVGEAYEEPVGEVETKLAEIWAEVLKAERVGRHDNFFALGGDSIRVIRVIARVREQGWASTLQEIFQHQTIAGLARVITPLSASEPTESLELPGSLISDADRSLLAADIEDAYSLSLLQMGMIFHNQLTPGKGTYHDVFSHHLRIQDWDLETFQVVLDALAQKHPILRTSIALEGFSEPLQLVHRRATIPVTVFDIRGLDSATQDKTIAEWLEQEKETTFDLKRAPLGRIFIHLRGGYHLQQTLSFHHAILDGWSVASFQTELFTEYAKLRATREKTLFLKPLATAFKTMVAREKQALGSEEMRSFWRDYLAGHAGSSLSLPQPEGPIEPGSTCDLAIPAALKEELTELAFRLRVPLRTVLLTAHVRVMSMLVGNTDVVTGVISHARPQERDGERILGLFLNTLPFRVNLGSGSWEDLVLKVFQTEMRVSPFQSYPYFQLFLENDRIPLVEAIFNYINFHVLDGLRDLSAVERLGMRAFEVTNFPLTTNVFHQDGKLWLELRFDSERLSRNQVERIGTNYLLVLQALASEPKADHQLCDCLSAEERRRVLYEWNDTRVEYEKEECIHRLFEAQARLTPEAIAVSCEGRTLTYGELNRQANRLAHYLRGLGVGPDERVALCAERSLEMVVGILGILKAGGGYVPLDPAYPAERLEYMLNDSGPVVLLVHLSEEKRGDLNALLTRGSIPVVDLEKEAGIWGAGADSDLNPADPGVKPHHLAYVIYTSGSTGKPKGVMVEHSNVVRLFSATQEWFHFDRNDVWTLFHSYAFDFSVWEIWGSLAYGGKLVVVPQLTTRSPQEFYRLLCEEKVTVLNQTPSAFRQLMAAQGDEGASHGLRYVIFGGEALEVSSLRPWYEREVNRETRLVNMYGITETTVHVTYRLLEPADTKALGASPIGRRIPDLTIYILDSHQQPVPIGVVGEMYVGGAGVARGYLNRAELTAERFVRDPFAAAGGARMYRTGDLGRWLGDGSIEYLGRNDQQVKIRGFRIELGEIEARLAEHPSVGEAAVLAREDQAGDKRLVAYVTTAESSDESAVGTTIDAETLRAYLSSQLPEYMVPAAYVRLEKFPLTANGKLDRKALPSPDREAYVGEAYEEPVGEVETKLAEIWAEVLKAERVGRHDNFFALGGDSIRVIRVIARVREQGWASTLQEIFQHQTIAGLARVITPLSASAATESQELPGSLISDADRSLLAADIEDAYSLSLLQMGMIFHNQLTPGKGTYHDVFSHHLRIQDWDLETFQVVLDALAQKHPILRTSIALEGFSEPLQLVHRRATIPVTVFDIRGLDSATQDKTIAEWLEQEKETTFDLKRAPLGRIFIHLRGGYHLQQTLSFHHAILDGWSVASFQTELFTEYAKLRATREKTLFLKPLATAFKTMVAREKQALGSEEMRSFWRDYLAGHAGSSLSLPQPEGPIEPGSTCEVAIPAALKEELTELAFRLRVPLRTVLLTAHVRVMSMLVGNTDVVTGVISHARPQERDGERILGLFLNTLPFRVNLTPGSWEDLILKVFQTEMRLSPFQSYPYFQLFLENDRIPLVEAIFNYINFHVLDGLRDLSAVETLEVRTFEATNFPLMINVIHQDGKLWLGLRFDPERLSRNQVERIGTNYLLVLQALASEPKADHQLCDCLPAEERRQVLYEWNATRMDYPQDKCIHELFEEQVRRTPQATAAVSEGEEVSYDDLNQRANRLAHYLRSLGVGPDERVGICLERGIEMIVALLAVLKAGGAYVPLDPDYPEERLQFMVQDSSPAAVLTHRSTQELARKLGNGVRAVELDGDARRWETQPGTNPERTSVGPTPAHLAYVIYTSGSTGKPKGVMLEHRNTVNLICWAHRAFSAEVLARTLFSTSLNFDLAVYECFVPLTQGASVRVVSSALDLANGKVDVTLINTVPSVMKTLMEDNAVSGTVQAVNVGGEPLKRALVEEIFAATKVKRVCNLYGPTETTTYSTCVEMNREDGFAAHIGRPIANTCVYILDGSGGPVPIGVTGEIYIGGAGVARGYLGNPSLTQERFVPDLFSSEPGSRMYRTGDLARWRADGAIEYLGRNDFQVKIRGFRIELGEIEVRLAGHPSVREAVVMAREDHPGEKRLVAYVTTAESSEESAVGTTIDAEALRAYLRSLLPEYMVPAAYVCLPKLPLTPNGKIDRKALPTPDGEAYPKREYEAPLGKMETTLARIWAEVLKLDRMGRHDNFFEVGGHSLLAVKVISMLRQIGMVTTVADIFNHPTIESFAASLLSTSVSASRRGARQIREGTQTPLFLVHDGYGDELYFYALAQHLPTELPIYGLPCVPENEPQLYTLQAMAKRMVTLVQEVQAQGPYRLAGWSFGGVLAYEIARQLLDQGHGVEFLGLMDAFCPGVNSFGKHDEKTPEAVLIELCEEQRLERSSGRAVMPAFDARDSNLDFEELFNRYRELQALQSNFEHLSAHEARVLCRNLDIHARAMEAYRPQSISIPLHLFVASEQPASLPLSTASLGWESCVPAHLLHAQTAPGSHHSMMKLPHIKVLGQRLTESLAAAATKPDSFRVIHASTGD